MTWKSSSSAISSSAILSKIKLAFTTDAFLGTNGSFYRPLQTVSFMLDALVGGPKPFIYHLTNLLLHIVGSLCVFWLLLTLGYHRLSSLLLALLFALHPMFVPMVAWVPTRGDLLLTIFVIVSFVLFIKSFRGNRPALVVWHGITFFLALLSKETAVAVPALCLLYYYFELRKTKARRLIKSYFVVWLIAGGAWYYLHSALHVVEGRLGRFRGVHPEPADHARVARQIFCAGPFSTHAAF